MSLAFNVLLHVLLIGSLGLFIVGIIAESLREPSPRERMLRIAALAAGALVTLGAQAAGLSYASYTVNALAGARPASAAANLGATILPGLLGAGLGFYLVRVFRRSDRMAVRVMGFVAMLAGTAFAQVYAQATSVRGVELGKAALPNIAFVTGVILCVVFTYDPDQRTRAGGSFAGALRDLVQRRAGDNRVADLIPTQGEPPRVARRDPFSKRG